MSYICVKEGEISLMCNGTRYDRYEVPLNYKDSKFWIYLGTYLGLVLFAGRMYELIPSEFQCATTVLVEGMLERKAIFVKLLMLLLFVVAWPISKLLDCLLGHEHSTFFRRAELKELVVLHQETTDANEDPLRDDEVLIIQVRANKKNQEPIDIFSFNILFSYYRPDSRKEFSFCLFVFLLPPFVKLLMLLLFVVAWPISKLLDCLLGHEHSTFFRRAELKELVVLHQETTDANEDPLRDDEVLIIQVRANKKNQEPIDIFSFNILFSYYRPDSRKEFSFCLFVFFTSSVCGHLVADDREVEEEEEKIGELLEFKSPGNGNSIQMTFGLLFVKSLIMVDPDDDTPIGNVYKKKSFLTAATTVPLFDLMDRFQTGKSHLCVVHRTQINEGNQLISRVVGIITLEDVLESLIQEEILDEADITRDLELLRKVSVAKAKLQRMRSVETRGPQNPISRSAQEFSSRGDRLVSDTSPLLSHSSDN
ncbi:PREDICTED: DUF21 domain-containing protein At5g52790-like [Acropora digitifera]|uniref:DUF21 domain-containing protein At5g52790-like n=1 Tax=Acropora digitifera TaxID=70779 RepID=UPI00077A7FB8|nr:PREDICTED: DUF21 domain-containing protein At5g52790-like [Acropora digitifera]